MEPWLLFCLYIAGLGRLALFLGSGKEESFLVRNYVDTASQLFVELQNQITNEPFNMQNTSCSV
jgi:hypothetical protein